MNADIFNNGGRITKFLCCLCLVPVCIVFGVVAMLVVVSGGLSLPFVALIAPDRLSIKTERCNND